MKRKTRIILALALLLGSWNLSSQSRFGIKGGYSHPAGYNAGVAVCFNMPLGFAIQPELAYVFTKVPAAGFGYIKSGNIELPVGIQYGLDLILLRPFVEVTPFIGCAVKRYSDTQNIFDYGVGVGGGLDIWRLQINARYKWSFADVVTYRESKHKGFEISLAFFF